MERPEVTTINQVWSMDFVSDQLFDGSRFRALTIVDNYSRKCMASHPEKSVKGEDVVEVLNDLKYQNGNVPPRIQVDNGTEFIT
jgi:putative transposase